MAPLEAPTEDGGWMPEPGPPGELCSGKLGEFSQAFRADSIFGSKGRRGMKATRERQRRGVGCLLPPPHSQGTAWALPSSGLVLPSE